MNFRAHQPHEMIIQLSIYCYTDFFKKLILYPDTLLKVFVSCRSSLVEFGGSLLCNIISAVNHDVWFLPFQFVSPWSPVVLSITSSSIWDRMGESHQACLVSDFSGVSLSVSSFNLNFTIDLLYSAFFVLGHFVSLVFLSLLIWAGLDFLKCFFHI